MRIALAQVNVTVGDLPANRRRVVEGILRAKAWQADIVIFPELVVTGYPPEDLLLKPQFIADNLAVLHGLSSLTQGLMAVVGFVDRDRRGRLGDAAAVFADGRRVGIYHKRFLPNYGVFDEKRYFVAGDRSLVINRHGVTLGVTICEDLWEEPPCRDLAKAGCELVVNLSASPYHAGKLHLRQRLFAARARANRVAIAYCNLVGGQDELVFDGGSLVINAGGRVIATARQFEEELLLVDLPVSSRTAASARLRPALPPVARPTLSREEEIYRALVVGTRDYVEKNGFHTVAIGLSGGIDSSLVACVAVDALGADRVVGVVMPSRYSSARTQADARRLANALGIRCENIAIEPCFRAYLRTLKPWFAGRPVDVTEQNIQARIRGNLLMALSNKFGWLVLTTGNKSEFATGYCTLYGDMAGGFAVIKDVPKMEVYRLARFRNHRGPRAPIPSSVFRRAPTAELAWHQTDQDRLPPYPVLDPILHAYIEEDESAQAIIRRHRFKPETVRAVAGMVDQSEYKRRQAPPGVKITPKAFGRDRRMPMTNRYQHGV